MTPQNKSNTSVFEIDQPDAYAHFLLTREIDILSYLRTLEKQHAIVTVYVDDGETFFLSSILAVNDAQGRLFLDPANNNEIRRQAENAPQLTLTAILDKVKIQIRIVNRQTVTHDGHPAIAIPLPKVMLRLQRREFFRLQTPDAEALQCKISRTRDNRTPQILNLPLLDISGGGISLKGTPHHASQFLVGEIFRDCRLEIPEEGSISVNLCVRETITLDTRNGQPYLRIGCEFVSLPGTRLAQIQRYITRMERERKARERG